jgi:hypothetical protein
VGPTGFGGGFPSYFSSNGALGQVHCAPGLASEALQVGSAGILFILPRSAGSFKLYTCPSSFDVFFFPSGLELIAFLRSRYYSCPSLREVAGLLSVLSLVLKYSPD